MKIIQANKYYYDRRGAEHYMLELSAMLEAAGHEVIPFAMSDARNLPTPWSKYFVSNLETEMLNLLHVPNYLARAFWSVEGYRKMKNLIAEVRPDILHVHNVYTQLSPSVLAAAHRADVPVVMTVHDYGTVCGNYAMWSGEDSLYPNFLDFISVMRSRYIKGSYLATAALEAINLLHRKLRLYDRYIDQYLAVSQAVKDVLVSRGIPAEKVLVQYNFAQIESRPRASEPKGFLFYGALDKSKGVEVLLAAAKKLGEPVYVAGNGPLRSAVEKAGGGVKYLGFLGHRDLVEYLAHVRAAVFPSIWDEPFSLSGLEALLSGTPTMVSDKGGFPEMVDGGRAGIIVPANDIPALERALRHAIAQPKQMAELGLRGQKWAQKIADPKAHLDSILRIYRKLLVDKS